VVRAGLTSKHVDVAELAQILDPAAQPVRDVPVTRLGEHELLWRPPTGRFCLSRVDLAGDGPIQASPLVTGPQILLCTEGEVTVRVAQTRVPLAAGRSVFVTAGGEPLEISGRGRVFRAAPAPA
jgi:mannose-6-phosphate isomerase